MRRAALVLALVLVFATGSLAFAQGRGGGGMGGGRMGRGGPGGGGGMGRGGGRGGGQQRPTSDADRIKSVLDPLALSSTEKAAAEKSLTAKMKARRALRGDLDKLRETGDNKQASQQQLSRAFDQYTKAMERYRTTVRNEDRALLAKLSLRGRVVCLAAGVLDNAAGMGSRRSGGGGGGGGMGGGGGRGGRGGGGLGGGRRPGGGRR